MTYTHFTDERKNNNNELLKTSWIKNIKYLISYQNSGNTRGNCKYEIFKRIVYEFTMHHFFRPNNLIFN